MSASRGLGLAALTVLALLASGCQATRYVVHVAGAQFEIQGNTEPAKDVLESGRLTDEENEKLRLALAAREYAEQVGLSVGNSYSEFYDTSGNPLAFNISAAPRDALEPYTWTFPIIGTVPYLAFFDEELMRAYEEQLQEQGLDTFTYELDAYSTVGVFADPIRSPMLRRGTLSLVETIFHELLHNTVFKPNNTEFNESLATFVGRELAVEFLSAREELDTDWATIAPAYYSDLDAVNAFLIELYEDVADYFSDPVLSSAERIAGRDAIFEAARQRFVAEIQPTLNYPEIFGGYADLPTNNAWLLGNYRYNLNLDLMEQVFEATGRDWTATLNVFRAAAAADQPFAFLTQWVADAGA